MKVFGENLIALDSGFAEGFGMQLGRLFRFFHPLVFLSLIGVSSAALIVDPAVPITEMVTVRPIIVSDDAGNNTATFLGSPSQRATIEAFVDDIWAQAGIDVYFSPTVSYDSSFALLGTSDPRPTSDLSTIVSNAFAAGGILDPDPNVINMFFVTNPAGFPTGLSANTAAGLAFVGGNGITQYVGANLPTFNSGREVVASVIAHEIGHNLGLPHIAEAENLMQEGGSPNQGERLNAAQIATALGSNFSVPIPEPSSLVLVSFGLLLVSFRRR